MRQSHWQGKTALICGASAGLGKAVTEELIQQGVSKLILLARGTQPLHELQTAWSRPQLAISVHAVDVCCKASLEAFAAQLRSQSQRIDLCVQTVGMSDRGSIRELTSEHLEQLVRANVISNLNALQCFENSIASPGGVFVLIGSLASLFAPRFMGGYAVAKHALAGLAQQARLEFAERGIHVMLVCPGPISRSDSGQRYRDRLTPDIPQQALQPGGGAKLKGLDSRKLARDILSSAAGRKRVLIRPRTARLLLVISSFAPRLADRILLAKTS